MGDYGIMGIDKLERVMWRLRKLAKKDTKHEYLHEKPTYHVLKQAIILECGHTPQTISNVKRALMTLGWLVCYNKGRCKITNKDLTEE